MNISRTVKSKSTKWLIISLIFLTVFAFSNISASSAYAVNTGDDNTGAAPIDYSKIFVPEKSSTAESMYSADDKVNIIVELDSACLLSQRGENSYQTTKRYLSSKAARSKEDSIDKFRDRVEKNIKKAGIKLKVESEYSAVISGFSAVAKFSDLDKIKEIKGVKSVFIAQTYRRAKPMLTNSTKTIGATFAQETGYTGKGTSVAILDSGLDVDHEAFRGTVNNPKYSKDSIADILKNNRLTVGKLSVNVLYHNSKIPYAYDYADGDYNVKGGDNHGTHVAGIVGANSGGTVKGVAPDAQLFAMKIFGDKAKGASDEDILSALDDSVKLGCETINMSLGQTSGFSEASATKMKDVYSRVEKAGINLICAAGNDYSSTYHGNSTNDLPLVSNPDNSVIASPSSYASSTAVASINNGEATDRYFLLGTEKIRYSDSSENNATRFSVLSGNYEFVDCGVGSSSDFKNKNLSGKIALIERGGKENNEILTFRQKEQNAKNAHAVAAIIYDNVEGDLVSMGTDHNIPIVFISKSDGKKLKNADEKKIKTDPDYIGKFESPTGGQMSDFSSWGGTPDLKLKPEITAPGGNIYSSLNGNRYGNLSGTSMASPHIAGSSAVMEQYVNGELEGTSMTQTERRKLINNLLLSTATVVKDSDGNMISPRKQGAGLANLKAAVQTGAYLTDKNGNKPVISLGDSQSGDFEFSFLLKRLKASHNDYKVSVSAFTEKVKTVDGKAYIAQQPRKLSDDELTVTAPSNVSLNEASTEISTRLALTDKGKNTLRKDFPNGIFIEGFVTLTPTNVSETVPLSIPFMGFYGDWQKSPLFDSTKYEDKKAAVDPMYLGQFDSYTGGGKILGHNIYGKAQIYDADKIAVKGQSVSSGSHKHVTAVTTLLRNAHRVEFSVQNSSSETIYRESISNVRKSNHSDEGYYHPMAPNGWTTEGQWDEPPPEDGRYTYTLKGFLNKKSADGQNTVKFPVTIDSKKPEIVKSEFIGTKWKITVRDNHYVQAVGITAGNAAPFTGWRNPDEKKPGVESTVTFDVKDPAFKDVRRAKIAITDYADNQTVSKEYSIPGSANKDIGTEHYKSDSNDRDWHEASKYDKNNDGAVDVEDYILALQ